MTDNEFWELVDKYERKDISKEDAIKEICDSNDSYTTAIADFSLLVKRTITKDEKLLIKEHIDGRTH